MYRAHSILSFFVISIGIMMLQETTVVSDSQKQPQLPLRLRYLLLVHAQLHYIEVHFQA